MTPHLCSKVSLFLFPVMLSTGLMTPHLCSKVSLFLFPVMVNLFDDTPWFVFVSSDVVLL